MNHLPSINILLVEDSPSDVRLTREALRDWQGLSRLEVVHDGVEAMAFLHREDPYRDVSRPDLILLDLNLPRKNGIEVLAEIKGDDDLKTIPVIVLTTSDNQRDILNSYRLHANAYLTKPVNFDAFVETMASVRTFWLAAATLSPRTEGHGS